MASPAKTPSAQATGPIGTPSCAADRFAATRTPRRRWLENTAISSGVVPPRSLTPVLPQPDYARIAALPTFEARLQAFAAESEACLALLEGMSIDRPAETTAAREQLPADPMQAAPATPRAEAPCASLKATAAIADGRAGHAVMAMTPLAQRPTAAEAADSHDHAFVATTPRAQRAATASLPAPHVDRAAVPKIPHAQRTTAAEAADLRDHASVATTPHAQRTTAAEATVPLDHAKRAATAGLPAPHAARAAVPMTPHAQRATAAEAAEPHDHASAATTAHVQRAVNVGLPAPHADRAAMPTTPHAHRATAAEAAEPHDHASAATTAHVQRAATAGLPAPHADRAAMPTTPHAQRATAAEAMDPNAGHNSVAMTPRAQREIQADQPTPSAPNRGRLKNGAPGGDPWTAPRCGARTRAGGSCCQPAMPNGRCRLHGGKSTGARTKAGLDRIRAAATKHGYWCDHSRVMRRATNDLLRDARADLAAARLTLDPMRAAPRSQSPQPVAPPVALR